RPRRGRRYAAMAGLSPPPLCGLGRERDIDVPGQVSPDRAPGFRKRGGRHRYAAERPSHVLEHLFLLERRIAVEGTQAWPGVLAERALRQDTPSRGDDQRH